MHKQQQPSESVPHAFLIKTASDYAYIAKCAIMDERTGEMYVDPNSLYSELVSRSKSSKGNNKGKPPPLLPRIFRNSHFQYFSPAAFPNYEPPRGGTPEVAFLGRSNTGKSSLINALSSMVLRGGGGRGSSSPNNKVGSSGSSGGGELARTSKRPGRTQTINYFGLVPNDIHQSSLSTISSSSSSSSASSSSSFTKKTIGNKQGTNPNQSKIYLVDLPGFGYASAPGESVDDWQRKTQEFLIARSSDRGGAEGEIRPWPEEHGVKQHQQQAAGLRNNNNNGSTDPSSSPPLKRLYLLLDSRLSNPTPIDLTVMGWCDEYSIPYTIVLTKVDGSSRANCVKLTNQMCMRFHSLFHDTGREYVNEDGEVEVEDEDDDADQQQQQEVCMDPVIYWTSSKDGLGMEELLLSVENNMFSAEEEYEVEDMMDGDDDDDDGDDFELEDDNAPGMGAQ